MTPLSPSAQLLAAARARLGERAARVADLVSEPAAAVFSEGDGRGPYRRLVDAAATQLADDGTFLLQLDRRVVSASRAELPAFRAALGNAISSAPAWGPPIEPCSARGQDAVAATASN